MTETEHHRQHQAGDRIEKNCATCCDGTDTRQHTPNRCQLTHIFNNGLSACEHVSRILKVRSVLLTWT